VFHIIKYIVGLVRSVFPKIELFAARRNNLFIEEKAKLAPSIVLASFTLII
jgi:hypothetical protein